jgi:hypothetical protein
MNNLSVSDGFKFGCGFMLAMLIAWLAMAMVSAILAAIFGSSLIGLADRFMSVIVPFLYLI